MKVWEAVKDARVYVLPETPVTSLKELFRRSEDVKVVPVVRDERSMRVLGFVTRVEAILPTSHRSRLRVKDVMREFPLLKIDHSVEEAYEYLREFNVSAAPVVDDDGRLAGVVSLGDLIEALMASGVKPRAETVSEVMTTEGVDDMLVEPGERVTRVWSKLVYRGYPAVIVVRSREDPVPIGIITPHDLVRKGRWLFHREIIAGRHPSPAKARRIMTRGVLVARPNTRIEDVAKIMLKTGFRVLPVVDEEGRVIGVVRDVDVVRSFIEGRKPGRVKVTPAPRPMPVTEEEKVAYYRESALIQQVQAIPKVEYTTPKMTAGEAARSEMPAITINDTVEHARKELLRRRTDYLFVVDEAGRVVGYVSPWTMLKAISLRGPLWRRRVHERFFIDFVMNRNIPRVREDEPLENVAYALISSDSEVAIVEGRDGSTIGFITKDDLVRAFARANAGRIRAEDVMVAGRLAYVHPHHSMAHAINKIKMLALDALAVYDGSRVYGVVSVNRIPFVAYEDARVARKSRRLIWVRKLVKGGARRGRFVVVAPFLAQDLMVEVKEAVKPDDDIMKVVEVMEREKVNGVPVVDEEGRLVGIVTKTTILREMARHSKKLEERLKEERARA